MLCVCNIIHGYNCVITITLLRGLESCFIRFCWFNTPISMERAFIIINYYLIPSSFSHHQFIL